MKRREVKRNRVTEVFHHPFAEAFGFILVVIFVRYHQIGNLEPNVRFVLEPFERVEHRRKVRKGKLVIKALGERFEVDVGGVDVAINFWTRFGGDVTGGDHHAFDSPFPRQT